MGKKQHQQDKMYITANEWTTFYGGKKADQKTEKAFKRLPFDHCSLSFQPFENPYCTESGYIFDLVNIVPWLKKYKTDPISGEHLEPKSLIKLHFHKNSNGKYHCPVTFKVFNENTYIVAIKTTGNVYANDAVEQLNVKAKNWKDLLTDQPFTRKDIVVLQDPTNLEKFNISEFHHIKNSLKLEDEEVERKKRENPNYYLKATTSETKDILKELYKEYKPATITEDKKVAQHQAAKDKQHSAHYSTGAVAASFTSTAVNPVTEHEAAAIEEDVLRYEKVKKKGYVRLATNKGDINLELHCEMVPTTCENFILLCKRGYYDGTIFHRSIRNFMIQGGDPTGTGKGGESAWGEPFKDEFKPNLSHTGRGILSMANSGPSSNKSQFFITFRSCKYLDSKHSVFGKVVGGLDTLTAMEHIETDLKDVPQEEIKLEKATVFVDPFKDADEQLNKEKKKTEAEEEKKKELEVKANAKSFEEDKPKVYKKGIGKYIASPASGRKRGSSPDVDDGRKAPSKKSTSYSFGSFSGW